MPTVDLHLHTWEKIDEGEHIAVCTGCGSKLLYPLISDEMMGKLKAVRRDGDEELGNPL